MTKIKEQLEDAIRVAKNLPYNQGYYSGLVRMLEQILEDIGADHWQNYEESYLPLDIDD